MGTMDEKFRDPEAKTVGRRIAEIAVAFLVLLVVILAVKVIA